MGGVLFVDVGFTCVNIRWLTYLRDVQTISNYAWGATALSYLYRNLCRATNYDTKNFRGFVALLQLRVWERIPKLRPTVIPPVDVAEPIGVSPPFTCLVSLASPSLASSSTSTSPSLASASTSTSPSLASASTSPHLALHLSPLRRPPPSSSTLYSCRLPPSPLHRLQRIIVLDTQKTKPTQHIVRELRALGLTPHLLTSRCTELETINDNENKPADIIQGQMSKRSCFPKLDAINNAIADIVSQFLTGLSKKPVTLSWEDNNCSTMEISGLEIGWGQVMDESSLDIPPLPVPRSSREARGPRTRRRVEPVHHVVPPVHERILGHYYGSTEDTGVYLTQSQKAVHQEYPPSQPYFHPGPEYHVSPHHVPAHDVQVPLSYPPVTDEWLSDPPPSWMRDAAAMLFSPEPT
ncbi:hypothetical protein Fmac_027246 [Flemingia macrophylla]|uniref:Aminotransferase-like plant mobile domain-containing protein n=1 Tax=Flemingia macrophylla TaxID=520843 RepID=A0ABD1LH76_9FABA